MKRINLSVDLDENEIFEKEVQNAIRAKTREVVRNTYQDVIKEEAEAEVRRIFDNEPGSWYRKKLRDIVRDAAYEQISECVKNLDMKQIVDDAVGIETESWIAEYRVVEQCDARLNSRIKERVEEKLKELLKD